MHWSSTIPRAAVTFGILCLGVTLLQSPAGARPGRGAGVPSAVPRTVDGKPNLQGIWQARSRAEYDLESQDAKPGMPASRGVVDGGKIPYQPWAAAKRSENFSKRQTLDPLSKCYLPGVPRIMYMSLPFYIFQTPIHVVMAFTWSQLFRQIYTDGSKSPDGIDFWMGDSRGHWEGDTLVVSVTNHNDKTWFDRAGNFHSDALVVIEHYTMTDADTIRYEATIQDPKVFTRSWKISLPLYRDKKLDRVLEFQCQAEAEEASGAFPREPRTWYPKLGEAK
jgi:hypothetical protein